MSSLAFVTTIVSLLVLLWLFVRFLDDFDREKRVFDDVSYSLKQRWCVRFGSVVFVWFGVMVVV